MQEPIALANQRKIIYTAKSQRDEEERRLGIVFRMQKMRMALRPVNPENQNDKGVINNQMLTDGVIH